MSEHFSYKSSGVDIEVADATKRSMKESLATGDSRVLNSLGAFASLFDAKFDGYEHPVLVLKMEEPGSKQKLALQHGLYRSICFDLVNHLINDIAVMGAAPLAVQDAIICGKLEPEVVKSLVKGMAEACREQMCSLVGGETSEQPGVIPSGTYILTASVVGVVDKAKIIDGSKVQKGDLVFALPSNGLHTNGYSLVRALLESKKGLAEQKVGAETFFEAIMKPHTCYFQPLRAITSDSGVVGLAHITGGGIPGNLNRIIPSGLSAKIDLGSIKVLPVFSMIRELGQISDEDMLRTFNLGVGVVAVVRAADAARVTAALKSHGVNPYQIGEIGAGTKEVDCSGALKF